MELWQSIVDIFRPKIAKPVPAPMINVYQNRDANRKAFLDMLAWSEGTRQIKNSDDGYRALVGGGTFDSYAAHPNKPVWIPRLEKYSTAAGRYQILYRDWAPYMARYSLTDFSPVMQDGYVIEVDLREVNALDDIDAGRFSMAVQKAGKRWASLPGSPYGQTIRTFDQVKQAYTGAGGKFSAT